MLQAKVPFQEPTPVETCQRVSDKSNGQDWWKCERCGSLWHELVQGVRWLPLSCPDRKARQ